MAHKSSHVPEGRPINLLPLNPLRFLDRAADVYPKKEAVVCGDVRLNYTQFQEDVNRLSNALIGLGVGKGDVVAYLELNCHRLLEAYFGVLQAGAILLPLNIRLSPDELAYIIDDSEAKALFADADLAHLIEPAAGRLKAGRVVLMEGVEGKARGLQGVSYEDLMARASPDKPTGVSEADEIDVAELFYTSGTTGGPKGVMMSHRELYLHALYAIASWGIRAGDRILHTVPLFHVNGWGTPQFLTAVGGTHVMLRRFESKTVFELVEKERVTKMFMVPTMALMLLGYPQVKKHDLRSLELIVLGGAPASKELIRDVEEKLGCRCVASYGLTETTPILTTMAPPVSEPVVEGLPSERRWEKLSKTGLPMLGVELKVVSEGGEEVKHDGAEVGEIVVRSDVVMTGYWKRAEETRKVVDGQGYLHTGDMAVVDEDNIVMIVDRRKDLIISGGENIASVEVERAVLSHPGVQECAVIGVPDKLWGEVPKAIVVPKPGQKPTEGELIDHCRERIAHFKCPKSVEFVDSLPRTSVGKIAKRVLREKYWKEYEKRVH